MKEELKYSICERKVPMKDVEWSRFFKFNLMEEHFYFAAQKGVFDGIESN